MRAHSTQQRYLRGLIVLVLATILISCGPGPPTSEERAATWADLACDTMGNAPDKEKFSDFQAELGLARRQAARAAELDERYEPLLGAIEQMTKGADDRNADHIQIASDIAIDECEKGFFE